VATPDSFADEEYYGVNAFIFVNEKGERHAVRYVMAPERLVHLSAEEAAKQAQDFLIDELPARLSRGPVTFRLKAQLAAPGDSTKDASIPWPESNETVELGMLTITKSASDSSKFRRRCCLTGSTYRRDRAVRRSLIGVRDGLMRCHSRAGLHERISFTAFS